LAGLVGKAHATLFSKRYGVLPIIGLGAYLFRKALYRMS